MFTSIRYVPWVISVLLAVAMVFWRLDRGQILKWYRAHTTASERAAIRSDLAIVRPIAEAAVPFVEQFLPGPGPEKFVSATERVMQILGQQRVNPNPDLVRQEVQRAYQVAKQAGWI